VGPKIKYFVKIFLTEIVHNIGRHNIKNYKKIFSGFELARVPKMTIHWASIARPSNFFQKIIY
jgi:hypothetical protein